jgi:nucleoside-diphosphate-sugar epimerase
VYPSFAFLYGDTGGEWVDESAPRRAPDDSPAFAAAMKAEDLILGSGIGCVLRCGYAYGPQSDAIAALVDYLRAGRPVLTGSATAFSNWVHVDDLAQALLLAAGKPMAGEIFNVVDDAPATPADFVRQLAANTGLAASSGLRSLLMRPVRFRQRCCAIRFVSERQGQTRAGLEAHPPHIRAGT